MKYTPEQIKTLVYIGFCQPKFYKPHIWAKAKKLMLIACEMQIVLHRPYRGGGHFWCTDNVSIEEVVTILREKLCGKE